MFSFKIFRLYNKTRESRMTSRILTSKSSICKLQNKTATCSSFILRILIMSSECRTCLKICTNVFDVFFEDLPSKIEEFSGVEILPDYGFSSKICEECIENIHRLYNFRDQIIGSNATASGGETKAIPIDVNPRDSHCRTCSVFSENLTNNLFCDGLAHKIEVITLCQISEDERLSSKICAECEEQVRTLYDFRNAIITNSAIVTNRLKEMEHDIDIEEMKLVDDTFRFNELVRESGGLVIPIREETKVVKKRIYVYKCLRCQFFTEHYRSWLKHSQSHQETVSIVCEICGKLIRKSLLSDHVKGHATKKLACPICGQILKHEITLKTNIKRHDKAIHLECANCGKLYKTRQAYKIHLNSQHGKLKKNHKCSLCEMRFYHKNRLEIHFRSHTGERPYVCKTCDKGFSSTNALKTHNRQHTQEKPYTCRYCDAAFKQSVSISPDDGLPGKICDECVENVNLLDNFRTRIIRSKEVMEENADLVGFECRTCLKTGDGHSSILSDGLPHKIETLSYVDVMPGDRFSKKICDECKGNVHSLYRFRNTIIKSYRILEERRIKKEEMEIEDIKLEEDLNELAADETKRKVKKGIVIRRIHLCKCTICGFLTPHYKDWQKHVRSHKEPTSICEFCGKVFKNVYFATHVMSHSETWLSCDLCGQKLKNKLTLQAHMRLHNQKELKCSVCEAVLKSRRGYSKHMLRHRRDKPEKCAVCERRFYQKFELNKHMRSHTGERPYLCKTCDKGFSSPTALKTHIRQHTQEKPFTCEFCDAAFKQAVLVRRHLKSKHPDKVCAKNKTK